LAGKKKRRSPLKENSREKNLRAGPKERERKKKDNADRGGVKAKNASAKRRAGTCEERCAELTGTLHAPKRTRARRL